MADCGAGAAARTMRRIGVLYNYAEDAPQGERLIAEFQQRLPDLGWTVGRNIQIDHRFGAGDVAACGPTRQSLSGLPPTALRG